MELIIVMGLIMAVIAAVYAEHTGKMSPKKAAAWGFCLGVIGLLVVVLSKPEVQAVPEQEG